MAKQQGLKRELGLFQVTVAGVGIILGAGIYALLGVAAQYAGNATWLSFLFSAFVALCTGLTYAELSSIFKGDSGEYDYTKVISKKFAWLIGVSVILVGVISAATVALGFSAYFTSLLKMNILIPALILVMLMSLINFIGIRETSWYTDLSTFLELAGLLLVIGIGVKYIGRVSLIETPHGMPGVTSAAALVFFAFMGFESIVKFGEETKNPKKVIPQALIYSVLITSVLYVLVAISAVSILGWRALSESSAPLATVFGSVLGGYAVPIITIIALFSTSNTVLLALYASSRQMYGMASEKTLPKKLTSVYEKTRTPWLAISICLVLTLVFVFIGDIEVVANLTNIFLFITFAAVNLGLIVMRYKMPANGKHFRVPINIGRFPVIALLGLLSNLALLVQSAFNLL